MKVNCLKQIERFEEIARLNLPMDAQKVPYEAVSVIQNWIADVTGSEKPTSSDVQAMLWHHHVLVTNAGTTQIWASRGFNRNFIKIAHKEVDFCIE